MFRAPTCRCPSAWAARTQARRSRSSIFRGWLAGSYNQFLSYLDTNPDFRQLVLSGAQRVLAPGTAITAFEQKVIPAPLIDGDYLKAYIEQVWAKFASVDLTFVGDPPPESNTFVTWTGRVRNGQFTLTTSDLPNLVPIVLNSPSTSDLFENNSCFAHPDGGRPDRFKRTMLCSYSARYARPSTAR